MNINFMRKVDFWCGVPLTALASFWTAASDALKRTGEPRQAQRILFIELSEMGSAILANPALKRMAARHECYFVIFKKNGASLRIFNTVPPERTFLIRENSFSTLAWDTLRFFVWCRRHRIEAVIDLELFSRFTALLSAFSGARWRVGFFNPRSEGLYRGRILTHPISYNPHIHIAKNFIALTEPFFAEKIFGENSVKNSRKEVGRDRRDPLVRREIADSEIALDRVYPAPIDRERMRELVLKHFGARQGERRIVLVNINAGDFLPQRKWPKSHFIQFIRLALEADPSICIVLTGSPGERTGVEELQKQVGSPRCASIAGDLRFEELPTLYAISDALLTNDSGPAHFASAVGLKTFVLFGPETPALYGPLCNAVSIYAGLACSPCVYVANHRDTPCKDNQCLKQIEPAFVAQQVLSFLSGTRPLNEKNQILRAPAASKEAFV